MRYFRKSARVTSPFLLTSISANHERQRNRRRGAGRRLLAGRRRGRWRAAGGLWRACGGGCGRRCLAAGGWLASPGSAGSERGEPAARSRRQGGSELRKRFIGGRPALRGVIRIGRHGPSVNVRAALPSCSDNRRRKHGARHLSCVLQPDTPSWLDYADPGEGSQVLGRQGKFRRIGASSRGGRRNQREHGRTVFIQRVAAAQRARRLRPLRRHRRPRRRDLRRRLPARSPA